MSPRERNIMSDAYVCMLRVPPDAAARVSGSYQRTLAALRDVLAELSGVSPEDYQDECEAFIRWLDKPGRA